MACKDLAKKVAVDPDMFWPTVYSASDPPHHLRVVHEFSVSFEGV